jgi:DNA-binding beta-propeller fold protein YncE
MVYATDYYRVINVSSTGNCMTVAGRTATTGYANGQGLNALFYYSAQLTMTVDGTAMYVVDSNNHVIRLVTTSGMLIYCRRSLRSWSLFAGFVSLFAGIYGSTGTTDGPATSAKFYYPTGVAVDTAGIVYISSTYGYTIRMIVDGEVLRQSM